MRCYQGSRPVLGWLAALLLAWGAGCSHAAPVTEVRVSLVPHAEAVGGPQTVSFGLPLPPGVLQDPALVAVFDGSGEVRAFVKSLGPWRSVPPAKLLCAGLPVPAKPGIRSVLLQFERTFTSSTPTEVIVRLGVKRTLNEPKQVPVRSTWRLVREGSFNAEDQVYEPKVYALLPPDWLACSNLTTLASLSGGHDLLKEYDAGQVDFFQTTINNIGRPPAQPINYKGRGEPWLYDRAQTFYNGYIRTGRLDFLREAHRAAQFYMKQVYPAPAEGDSTPARFRGYFKLSNGPKARYLDPKYSYNECLATLYWMTGDTEVLSHLPNVTSANLRAVNMLKRTHTKSGLSGWTERNAANALLALVFEYEVTGDPEVEANLKTAVDVLYKMQTEPPNGWPPMGAFLNYVTEAGTTAIPSWSPWMSSLLAHALLRAYHTLGDERIPGMLVRLAQAELDFGVRSYKARDGSPIRIPRYVAAGTGDPTVFDKENNPGADVEHGVDVAYVTALGAFFATDPAKAKAFRDLTLELLRVHNGRLKSWTRPKGLESGLAVHRLTPPRKYAWWYKNTGALGWVLGGPTQLRSGGSDVATASTGG